MVQSLKVILWGEEIGRLAWDTRRRLSCFMYNPVFLKKGLNIFPLAAPVDGARGLTPVWGEEAKIYQKNYGSRSKKGEIPRFELSHNALNRKPQK